VQLADSGSDFCNARVYRDFMWGMFSLYTCRFTVGLIILRRIGLCFQEVPSLGYLSAFRDFYTAISPVPRTGITYIRLEPLTHDIA